MFRFLLGRNTYPGEGIHSLLCSLPRAVGIEAFHSLWCWGENTASTRLSRYSATKLSPYTALSPEQIQGGLCVDVCCRDPNTLK